jgi:hypothetical protein
MLTPPLSRTVGPGSARLLGVALPDPIVERIQADHGEVSYAEAARPANDTSPVSGGT